MRKDTQMLDEQPVLIIKGIHKSFEDNEVLTGIGFEILDGEVSKHRQNSI